VWRIISGMTKNERLTALLIERNRLANQLRGVQHDRQALQAAIGRLSIEITELSALPDIADFAPPAFGLFAGGLGDRRSRRILK
jgi:hypothetical protein